MRRQGFLTSATKGGRPPIDLQGIVIYAAIIELRHILSAVFAGYATDPFLPTSARVCPGQSFSHPLRGTRAC